MAREEIALAYAQGETLRIEARTERCSERSSKFMEGEAATYLPSWALPVCSLDG
jgi:hypothetical protein